MTVFAFPSVSAGKHEVFFIYFILSSVVTGGTDMTEG